MIAEIALNQKTQKQYQLFSYKVEAKILPEIKVGQVVEIDFNRKRTLGVIMKLARKNQTNSFYKLKRIQKIIHPGLTIKNWQIQLAKFICQKYAVCFGQALFSILPKFAKKPEPIKTATPGVATGKTHKIKYLTGSKLARWQNFQKIAHKTSAIFIFPQLRQARLFIQKFCPDARLFHSGLPSKQQTQIYLNCLSGNLSLVVGSFSALFLPLKAPIIIEDYLSPAYQKDQSPKYEIVQTAKKLSQLKNVPLILADDSQPFWRAPALETKRIKLEVGLNIDLLLQKNLKAKGGHLVWRPYEYPSVFSLPRPKISTLHLVFTDSYLSQADFRLNEEIFYLIRRALNLSQDQIVIYLSTPAQSEKIQKILQPNFKKRELKARQKHGFPPFQELIKIDYRQKISYNIEKRIKDIHLIDKIKEGKRISYIFKAPYNINLDYSKIYPGIVSRNIKTIK